MNRSPQPINTQPRFQKSRDNERENGRSSTRVEKPECYWFMTRDTYKFRLELMKALIYQLENHLIGESPKCVVFIDNFNLNTPTSKALEGEENNIAISNTKLIPIKLH